jgi:hypothetical protein
MITVIRVAFFELLHYWKKPVTGYFGQSRQNGHFIVVIGTQEWSSSSPKSYKNWFQVENSRFNTDLLNTRKVKNPIVFRHTEIPCLRPAVSSLGACPTPAR